MRKTQKSLLVTLILFVITIAPVTVWGQNTEWIRQFGSSQTDNAEAVGTNGDVYVAGNTNGALPGQTNIGGRDVFVRKYDVDGTEVWTRQFGTSGTDEGQAISVDVTGVYVAGFVAGTLPGQTSAGSTDAFMRKYDFNGTEVWTRQFGTSAFDRAGAISVDSTGVYVAGNTGGTFPGQTSPGAGTHSFVRKYDLNGTEVWTRQFGASSGSDRADGISVDSTGVYVTGIIDGVLPGQTSAGNNDAYVRKYDSNGTEVWTRQFGTSGNENSTAKASIKIDVTGVYVSGDTTGTFPGQTSAGNTDAFVRKYDVDGTEVWTRQFGTSAFDNANSISVDSTGVYVVGQTAGTFPGQTSAGGTDVYVRKYDFNGTEVWILQFGTSNGEFAAGVSVDSTGVYVAGGTSGIFPGQTPAGSSDAFVVKIGEAETLQVSIDIKPGSDPNCFNNNGNGVIPVAILSSPDFDATTVDPVTVKLDGQAVRVVGKGNVQAHEEDSNGDGLTDLVVQIEDEDGTYEEGDTVATLTGETFDGTSIEGTDSICIIP